MAGDNVAVKFSADISDLTAGLSAAKDSLDQFTANVVKSSGESITSLQGFENSVKELTETSAGLTIISRLLSGTALSLGTTAAASLTLGGAFVVTGIELGKLIIQSAAADQKLNDVRRSMAAMGTVNLITTGQTAAGFVDVNRVLESYVTQLKEVPGVTTEGAEAILSQLGSIKNYSTELNEGILAYIVNTAKSGQEAKALATQLTGVFSDPIGRGREFIEALKGVTQEEQASFEAAQRSGNINQVNAALLGVLTGRLRAVGDENMRTTREVQQAAEWLSRLTSIYPEISEAAETTAATLARQSAELQKNTAEWQKRGDAIRAAAQTPAQLIDTGTAASRQESTAPLLVADVTTREIQKISDAMDALRVKRTEALEKGQPVSGLETQIFNLGVALDAAKTKDKALADQMAGGSGYARRQQDIQNTTLLTRQSAVLSLEAQVAADKEEMNRFGITQAEKRAAYSKYAQDVSALEREKSAVVAAQAAKDAQEQIKGSAAELAEKQKGVRAQIAATAEGSKERIDLERQEAANQEQFENTQLAIARDRETGKYNIAVNGLAQRVQLIKEEAQQGKISHAEELALLLANNAEREGLERTHFTFLMQSYKDDLTQFSNYQRQREEVESASAVRSQEIHRQVAKEIDNDYKRTFEAITSSAGSALSGMITGQQTFKQASQSVATALLNQFIQDQAKKLAAFLASTATELTVHTAAEAGKTAATAGGVGVRTAAESAGSATSMAATLANALRSIGASLGMTFAGVSANQAPLIGPAAPAEAAAVTAAVDAAAMGFLFAEVGSWKVPGTSRAIVHADEMIIPKPFADDLRDNGGGLGATTHLHFPGVMDTQAFMQAIRNNSSPIAKMIAKAMTQNSSLRPAY